MPETVKNKYQLDFDPETQFASSEVYTIGFSPKHGLVNHIAIKPPYGTGVDFFDTQKVRFNGLFSIGDSPYGTFAPGRNTDSATENAFIPFDKNDYMAYVENPVVRSIRETRYTFFIQTFSQIAFFYVTVKLYPYSGTIKGGASIDPEELAELYPTANISVELDYLRQSWDLSEQATGMTFYNHYNRGGIPIDGNQDAVDTRVDLPIEEWSMVTGNQGTLFSMVHFDERNWQTVALYYHDNSQGGQADSDIVSGKETGDGKSFGDHGIYFRSLSPDSPINLELDFTAYFLAANQTLDMAEELVSWTSNPAYLTAVKNETPAAQPDAYLLLPAFPNPFNAKTRIRFLSPASAPIRLEVRDIRGRHVKTIANRIFTSGQHDLYWDGTDESEVNAPSGIYFYLLDTPGQKITGKMLLVR